MNKIVVPSEDPTAFPPLRSVTAGGVTYRFGHQIGIGAFSKVYKGMDSWGNPVVAKILSPDAKAHLWEREVTALHRFRHPCVVYLLASFAHGGRHYIVMEDAGVCVARMTYRPDLRPKACMGVARGLLQALAFVHAGGYIHGDVCPNNVLLDTSRPAAQGQVRLADFAFCRTVKSLEEGRPMIAPWQPAPENLDPGRFGRLGTATDVYLACVILLHVLEARKYQYTEAETLAGAPAAQARALGTPLGKAVAEGLNPVASARPTAQELWRLLREAYKPGA